MQRFFHRYPYTTFLLAFILVAACMLWLLTHEACAHPLGNAVASLMGFGFVPLRLVCLVLAEAGVE